jgi:ribosomal protein S18 acetylase RimI-like enzyme
MSDSRGICIKRASAGNAGSLSDLRRQFWRDQQASGLLETPPDCTEHAILKLIDRPRTHVMVAENLAGELKGYLFGQTKFVPGTTPVTISSVEEVYVPESSRGEGIAAHLAEAAVKAFREDGADRIQLRVLYENEGGSAFWGKIGFQPYLTVYELVTADATA